MENKEKINNEGKTIKEEKYIKLNSTDKVLYTCESVIDAEEHGKTAKYFPMFFRFFAFCGTLFSLLVFFAFYILFHALIYALVVAAICEIYMLLYSKLKTKDLLIKAFNKNHKNGEHVDYYLEFYENYFIRGNNLSVSKYEYKDIEKCIETDTNFYFKGKNIRGIIIIQKNRCDLELISFIRSKTGNIENKLGDSTKVKRARKTHNPKIIKTFMIILFILTISSLWLAPSSIQLVNKTNSVQGINFIKNTWILWCWLPIPILSIILGFKYKRAGFKCTKNIVAGFIIGFFLLIYGSFSLIDLPLEMSQDYNKIYEYQDIIDANLPSSGEIVILNLNTYHEDDKTNYVLINVYYNSEDVSDLVMSIENSDNWILSNELKSGLKIFIPSQLRADNDAYFSIYNKTTNQYNKIPDIAGNYEIYAMKYDISEKHLEIHKFDYLYK